jgi:Zinc finger, C3HC4 type (RING finger)
MSSSLAENTSTRQSAAPLERQESGGGCRNSSNNVDARFSCNICFDSVVEPVVTQCGHLYCWPCLYRWLEPGMYPEERASLGLMMSTTTAAGYNTALFDTSRRVCPVCKSACSVPTLVPIYVRSTNEPSPVNNSRSNQTNTQGRPTEHFSSETTETTRHVEERVESRQEEQESPSALEPLSQQQNDDMGHDENLGLRRRQGRQADASASTTDQQQHQQQVPNRPAASSPQHSTNRQSNNTVPAGSSNSNNNWMSPMSPNGGRHGSLTQGILVSFHQAAMHAQSDNDETALGQQRTIPSLHDIRDGSYEGHPQQSQPIDVNSETTQYLSRLLIMLTSFVVLCLLLL